MLDHSLRLQKRYQGLSDYRGENFTKSYMAPELAGIEILSLGASDRR